MDRPARHRSRSPRPARRGRPPLRAAPPRPGPGPRAARTDLPRGHPVVTRDLRDPLTLRRSPGAMTNDRPASLVIGIAGGTGAGKTTLVHLLCDRYADVGVALLDMDSYYLDRGHLAEAERASLNYDEPDRKSVV